MKEFFKFTLATILGLLVTGFIFMIIGIASVAGLLASSETETTVHNNSVFVLDLQGSIAERYQPTPIDQLLVAGAKWQKRSSQRQKKMIK